MNISQIITLPPGQIGLSCEGTVVYCKPAKNIVGICEKPGRNFNKAYNFWTQFILIEDSTGKIAIDLTIEANRGVDKGEHIRITNGVLEKNGENFILKKAKLATPLAASPSSAMMEADAQVYTVKGDLIQMPPIQKPTPMYQPSETDKQRSRGVALSYCLDKEKLDLAFIEPTEREGVYDLALEITQFMLTGINPYTAKEPGTNG